MNRHSLFILIAFLLLLFFFSKPFRHFLFRATSGILVLAVINALNIGVSFNYIGLALSSFLGIPGALSFAAISHIL